MSDNEHGAKWWIRFVIVPLIGGGGLIAIMVAFINRPTTQGPAPIVKGPSYNEVHSASAQPPRREAQASRTSAEMVSSKPAETAQDPPVASERKPISSSPEPAASTAPAELGVFKTDTYTLRVEYLRHAGDYGTAPMTLECVADKPTYVSIGSCYLLDENGTQWDLRDPTKFTMGIDLIPGTKARDEARFVAKGPNNGTSFTLICRETYPESGRHIVVRGVPAR